MLYRALLYPCHSAYCVDNVEHGNSFTDGISIERIILFSSEFIIMRGSALTGVVLSVPCHSFHMYD